ncbi:MAG: glycosyltransferase, partial [Verrucomicrobiae bacterium]|nr:glycosyltransferase [Verrucomicrobiae bacterium]
SYDVEEKRVIAAVRNKALQLAQGNYIGIIDDDEFAPSTWLVGLYRAIHTFDVDGALGPVFPFFERQPPRWLLKSGLCEPQLHRTGKLLHWTQCYTGNCLVMRKVFDDHNLRFDENFRTGGSDQDFFRRAMALGYRFVAVQEAPVYEVVPPERWEASYWVKRALVNGFNSWRYVRGKNIGLQIKLATKSFVAVPLYVLGMVFVCCLGRHALVRFLEKGAYHLSRACAACGLELWKTRDF